MQCNDIVSNIVLIRMFFTLFSNRMIGFFLPFRVNCSQVAMFQIMPALCPHGEWEEAWSTICGQAWTGGPKNSQICEDILYGWPPGFSFRPVNYGEVVTELKKIDKGPLRNDITAEMSIEIVPHPYVNVSHFLLYPLPLCHQINSGKRLPWSKTLKNNFT